MQRVAVVGGVRTPFVRAGGVLASQSFIDLGTHVTRALVPRLNIDPKRIDEFIFGSVLVDPKVPNFAREIIFRAGLPRTITAHAISNNCISGLVAVNMIAEGIRSGRIHSGLAGGSESMSRPTLVFKPKAEAFFLDLARARSLGQKLSRLIQYRPGMAMPLVPSPKEPSTGLTMGEHCELMAKEFKIARTEQDEIAFKSHQNAARAQKDGYLSQEIEALGEVKQDNIIRADTSLEKLAKLSPVFDRSAQGTLTAGNSSPLTDGASIVCLMSEARAKEEKREILGYIEATEYASIEPKDGLLMAPAVALPRLFQKNNLKVSDVDVYEVHEAFAAQVAANILAWKDGWKKEPQTSGIGQIPLERMNVNGGSIAIGHPFAATGGRLILSALNQLKRTQKRTAVISVCAAGAMGCAMLLRRD